MGQKLARKEVEDGLKLYSQQNCEEAVRKWKRALHKVRSPKDKFTTLGYLAAAHCDWGKYRDMLAYAVMQIDVANEADSCAMRAEAYLNLARSNEHLCEYHKAVSYSRHSLQNQPRDPRIHGYVYLCQANAYFGFSSFSKALENLEQAMRVSKQFDDPALEVQLFSCLGTIFTGLKDYEKGLAFFLRAAEIAKSFRTCDQSSKYERVAYYNLALPYRKMGRYSEAVEFCEDALKMAINEGDRLTQAKCLSCSADIHRRRHDLQRAFSRYETAVNIMVEIGDRYDQVAAFRGMAKTMVLMKNFAKALDFSHKALDLARSIGCKLQMMRCHIRLEELYDSLGDAAMADEHNLHVRHLLEEMDLYCGVCGQEMGDRPDSLEALPCCHIVHVRCAVQICNETSAKRTSIMDSCPRCRQTAPPNSVYL